MPRPEIHVETPLKREGKIKEGTANRFPLLMGAHGDGKLDTKMLEQIGAFGVLF